MPDVPPTLISEAFVDPSPLPDAVTMCGLIAKAKHCTAFDKREYEWLHFLLQDIWYSQEFRTRMRLYAIESELRNRNEQAKKAS